MSKDLNSNLYKRFGLTINKEKVEGGFCKYILNQAWSLTEPLRHPEYFEGPYVESLQLARNGVIERCCREMFLDSNDYEYTTYNENYMSYFLDEILDKSTDSFEDKILKLQIFINICYEYKDIREEVDQFVKDLKGYIDDFPMLGITIKTFKNKSPQIFPTTSQKFSNEIANTLGLLEVDEKYSHVLTHYESGLKEFLGAKTQAQYKDVIEDMYTACDELIKAISEKSAKGFRHISDKDIAILVGMNGQQKELFKNLREWMDQIKHGTNKKFQRKDTEMIISMAGSLIRFVLN